MRIFCISTCRPQHLAVFLVMLLARFGSALGQTTELIRFAPEKDYGPFIFEDLDGQIRGLSMDVLDALKPMLTSTIAVQEAQTLARILEDARRGQVDLISSVRPTVERSAYLDFTSPYVQVPAVLVVRQSVSPARLQDLAGQRVAVGKDFAVESFVREAYPLVHWQAVPDDRAALQGLLNGKYQAVVADIASVSFVIRRQKMRGLQTSEAIGFNYPLSFAYRKELTDFGGQLQTALLRLDDQQRQQILDRWVDANALRFEDPRLPWLRRLSLMLTVMSGALLSFAHWQSSRRASP